MTMSITIYKHEFRMRLKSVITWSVAVAVLIFIYFSIYPAFAKDAELLNQMMANFPEELLMAFGMTGIDLASVMGFYSFLFLFAQICLAIQAANYGFGLVSMEERELTADFLLSKPVSRTQILTSKLLAAFTGLTITNAVIWIASFAAIALFSGGRPYDGGKLLLLLLSIVVFQLVFLAVGVVISLLVRRIRSVTPYTMALAFGAYVLSAFGGMMGDAKLELLTPFKHFEPNYIIQHGAYDVPLVMISVAAIVVSVAGSYWLYTRRDIPSVT